jgi:hypothetical protein
MDYLVCANGDKHDRVVQGIHLTINGIAAGLRNSVRDAEIVEAPLFSLDPSVCPTTESKFTYGWRYCGHRPN